MYLIRNGLMEQVSKDHTLAEDQVERGIMTRDEVRDSQLRHILSSVIGVDPRIRVHMDELTVFPGDMFLLCSDGLTDIVRDGEIAELITSAGNDPDAAAEALVAAANQAGGIDNITVVLFEIVEGEPSPLPADPMAVAEPDEETLERTVEVPPTSAEVPVQRHGAGPGSRWLALAAILLTIAVAALLIWWSVTR
jgi:serine/threonine protein phosphatase PrpC